MACRKKGPETPAFYVNHEDLKGPLEECLKPREVRFASKPAEASGGVVLKFLSSNGEESNEDVFDILLQLKSLKPPPPVFVVDEHFHADHSGKVWLHPLVVGYLTLDEPGKTWKEIGEDFGWRLDALEERRSLGEDDLYPVGWSVSIDPEGFEDRNFVSLFIGEMRKFIVELKRALDNVRPDRLDSNPIGSNDLTSLLGNEHERRLGKAKNKKAHELFTRKRSSRLHGQILVCGETGTGKSIIARFVHDYLYKNLGKNAGELRKATCSNIGEKLLETELFGSVKGAFTDAETRPGQVFMAYNGTLFLDEVGELPLPLQAKLLQYLDDRSVYPSGWLGDPIHIPCTVVAATNRDLEKEVEKGYFRRDLFHRLGHRVVIPPMRERKGDLERLVDFVLQNPAINGKKNRLINAIEKAVVEKLKNLEFKGNFRELEQLLRRAVLTATSRGLDVITSKVLETVLPSAGEAASDEETS